MTHALVRITLCSTVAALALASLSTRAYAEPEQLEVTFDLEQYSHPGSWSFSRGCTHNPPTGRNNYVHMTVVWLEDAAGNYVTTLHRWGRTYVYNLKRWADASDMAIDGVTSATPTSNGNNPAQVFRTFTTGAHDISALPDGNYQIRIESTQCELAGEYVSGPLNLFGPDGTFAFTKGRQSQTNAMVGDAAPFRNVRVQYTVPTGNAPPGVRAGVDILLMPSVNPSEATARLSGIADDEGPSAPTTMWRQVRSEPAGQNAQIASPSALQTDVTFTSAGVYTFELSATDAGGLTSTDEVMVFVNARLIDVSHDAEVARGQRNVAMGVIENAGPWVFTWGQCNPGDNYSRGYFRFPVGQTNGAITMARLRLPRGEATPNNALHHDFYILDDTQDDWNTNASNSTDWQGTITFNNQPVVDGLSSNLSPGQLIGTFTHDTCRWRHSFNDPTQPVGPASECPGWLEVDLDVSNIANYDSNNEWSVFMSNREGCNNGIGIGSSENAVNPQLLIVEHWQSTANLAPTANAGADMIVRDVLPAGTELVTFDGSASSDDAGIVTYAWSEGGTSLGSSADPVGVTALLTIGVHDIQLTVTDGEGLSATDTVQIVVEDRFYPNHSQAEAVLIDGSSTGKKYDDLFAYTAAPNGDWYALDLVDGSSLDVSITMDGGDLDVAILDATLSPIATGAAGGTTESASAQSLSAGRYYVTVTSDLVGASRYEMTVTVGGPTIAVELNPSSGVESAGTLVAAGRISITQPAASALSVMLTSELPTHLDFAQNPVVIAAGETSAPFDIVLVDDPSGAPDENRYVQITASASGYNRGSAVFEILDDEATLVVVWNKAAETVSETGTPLFVVSAVLSGTPTVPVTVPFTISGTAQAGSDYEVMGSSSELTIAGTTMASVIITIRDDDVHEDTETLIITMGTPTGANAGTVQEVVVTIQDDDEDGNIDPVPNPNDTSPAAGGCACTSNHVPASGGAFVWLVALGLFVIRRRRT